MTEQHDDWFERQRVSASTPTAPFWNIAIKTWGRPLVGTFGRLQVTGSISPKLLQGPLLIAPNHIGNFDALALSVAMGRVGLHPRFLATAGLMSAPVVGHFLESAGSLRVDRGKADAARSMELVALALKHNAHLVIYPEGRVSLDPDLWPEKGKTGLARLALQHGVPVIPVAQWGAHEVVKYEDNKAMLRSMVSSIWRQPAMRIHFGEPVGLSDLTLGRPGDALRASRRIVGAITRDLVTLRAGDLGSPKYVDETRPIADRTTAAFPGGVVPDNLP